MEITAIYRSETLRSLGNPTEMTESIARKPYGNDGKVLSLGNPTEMTAK